VQKIRDCPFPEDVLYDSDKNVWVKLDQDLAVVGIDVVLAWLSGPFTAVSFKEPGTVVERGKSLGSVEGPRHFDTVRAPLTGRIVAVNSSLKESPKLLNREPYGEGWFVKMEPTRLEEEKGVLLGLESARGALERKVTDFNVRCFAEYPDHEMFEIGSECAGILVKLDDLIARSPPGVVVHLVSDDVTAEIELNVWSERTHNELVEVRREGKLTHFIIRKSD
jgi:glycine cleavage system H lipoate-binding protein/TusA-related sulfurtransferase